MRRISKLLKLRTPTRDAVKHQYMTNAKTRTGMIWLGVFCVAAIGMATAFFMPYSDIVYFFGNYGLACFFPLLTVLLIRKWNRTLAFPAALLLIAIAVIAGIYNVRFDGWFDSILITFFIVVTLVTGATSDRLSPIYKWKTPLNYIGLVAVAFGLFFLVYGAVMIMAVGFLLLIALIALLLMIVTRVFGIGRRRW